VQVRALVPVLAQGQARVQGPELQPVPVLAQGRE
jgi:hypothetical protein